MTEIVTVNAQLVDTSRPLGQNPAAVYLASLTSERSRRVMAGDLRTLGALLTGVEVAQARTVDPLAIPWQALRYSHTAALRARLVEHDYRTMI